MELRQVLPFQLIVRLRTDQIKSIDSTQKDYFACGQFSAAQWNVYLLLLIKVYLYIEYKTNNINPVMKFTGSAWSQQILEVKLITVVRFCCEIQVIVNYYSKHTKNTLRKQMLWNLV